MSRKHYRALAAALAESGATVPVVCAVANVCRADNPRFDFDRFMAAAGVNSSEWREAGGMGGHYAVPTR